MATPYYFGLMNKYTSLFGSMFNNIYIERYNDAGEVDKLVHVPIGYGPREKYLTRTVADPNMKREIDISLPRMTFEITNIQYANDRKMNTIGRRLVTTTGTDSSIVNYQLNPVPYDIHFQLNILAKTQNDGLRIVEQILPYFTPDWTTSVELIPEMNESKDIPIILMSTGFTDNYESNFEVRRMIIWTMNFTLKGYFYGPVKSGKVILYANTDFYTSSNTVTTGNSSIYPGLTANGEPTSNASLTIPATEISANSDYGYVVITNLG